VVKAISKKRYTTIPAMPSLHFPYYYPGFIAYLDDREEKGASRKCNCPGSHRTVTPGIDSDCSVASGVMMKTKKMGGNCAEF
jgi:hypothetical protein